MATLTANINGSGPFSYEWYVVIAGHPMLASSGATFATAPQVTTNYQLVVRNSCGEARSGLVTVTVTPSLPRHRSARH